MREFEPVHGVDFLVNFYAILSIPRDADKGQIKQAYRTQIRMYHPDVVSRAAPEIRKQAERKSGLINQAYKILSDDGARAEYDKKLDSFNPALISDNGNIIVSLNQRRLDLDYLVGEGVWKEKGSIMQSAKMLSGHNDEIFRMVAEKYKADKNPSPELKRAYKEALEKKNTYLTLLEETQWEDAGISNQEETSMLFYPEDHIDKRKSQIKRAEEEIAGGIEGRVLALASGMAPKMLGQGGEVYSEKEAAENPIALREKLTRIAVDRFKTYIPELEKIAEERAKVMEELVSLTDCEYYPPGQKLAASLTIVLEKDGKFIESMAYQIVEETVRMAEKRLTIQKGISIDKFKSMNKELDEFCAKGQSLIILYTNKELDVMLQMGHALREHINKLNDNPSASDS